MIDVNRQGEVWIFAEQEDGKLSEVPLELMGKGRELADQLKVVAQLIAGGLKTRIYVVNLGGFDTHSAQVASTGGTETGLHATLLGKLSLAIAAFQDDLHLLAA